MALAPDVPSSVRDFFVWSPPWIAFRARLLRALVAADSSEISSLAGTPLARLCDPAMAATTRLTRPAFGIRSPTTRVPSSMTMRTIFISLALLLKNSVCRTPQIVRIAPDRTISVRLRRP
jgi:hypothetical protein